MDSPDAPSPSAADWSAPDAEPDRARDAAEDPGSEIPPHRPLEGTVVVDLSRHLPGPLVGRLLADLGARVIKVEEPKLGDPSRQAPPLVGEVSSLAALLLSGHDSLALDLKKPTAREVVENLLMSADVLVESFRPGVLQRLGLAQEELRRLFPSLVICSVTGWGQGGPHALRAGHDLSYQAIAGSLAGGGGMPAVQVADLVGAWSATNAVSAALLRRERTGDGCWIDQALLDAAGHAALTGWAAEADGPKAVGEPLYLTGALPCYDLYRTRDDGSLALAPLEPKFWRAFCDAVGRKDLILKQFSSDPAVRREVADLVRGRTRDEWAALMAEHDIPAEPVLSAAESLSHPQVQHRGMIQAAGDGTLRLGYPAKLDGERPRGDDAFPGLGEHTESVLNELGLAAGLSTFARRRGGIGRRFSVRRWATRVATAVATRRKKDD
ncbi:MAG: CaiB/BaiF CoA-transferase family protein [Acidobacteriota bacterium]